MTEELHTYYCKDCFKKQEQIDRLEQDIKQLTQWLDEARNNADFWCNKCTSLEQENKQMKSALEEINRVVKLAHKVEDYLLGQDYTDLVDRIEKEINEVLGDEA